MQNFTEVFALKLDSDKRSKVLWNDVRSGTGQEIFIRVDRTGYCRCSRWIACKRFSPVPDSSDLTVPCSLAWIVPYYEATLRGLHDTEREIGNVQRCSSFLLQRVAICWEQRRNLHIYVIFFVISYCCLLSVLTNFVVSFSGKWADL